jgi:CRISPR-associated protein Cmr5
MNKIDKLIPAAMKAVTAFVIINKKVPREFNGYISSFGASVISSGLLPTIVFFSQEGKSNGDRTSVIKAIEAILKTKFPDFFKPSQTLLDVVVENVPQNNYDARLVEKIQDAAIALKLAIRIFPKSEKESNHE